MTAQKSFPLTENLRLRIRAQAYNLFNHPVLGNPDIEQTSVTFGQIRASNVNYTPRSLQLGVRFEF